ncbi:MAG: copper oxidase [Methylococcaceae bacterium]|jgi:plastocyanin
MTQNTIWTIAVGLTISLSTAAAEKSDKFVEHNMLMDHGAGHLMDMDGGMVMGQNKTTLPPGCPSVSEDKTITVRAGHQYAKDFPGTMFGFDSHEWRVKPCTRLTVNFINEDNIRHQWMMHGLPKFIYDKGMFHLEMTGPAKITGTLILPAEDKTYLVHCDIAQHMEKGMKGQLIVGNGSTPFPSIPGLTDFAIPDDYGPKVQDFPKPAPKGSAAGTSAPATAASSGSDSSPAPFMLGIILGGFGAPFALGYYKRRFAGMTSTEVLETVISGTRSGLDKLIGMFSTLIARFSKK